jgi:hypothetical protein
MFRKIFCMLFLAVAPACSGGGGEEDGDIDQADAVPDPDGVTDPIPEADVPGDTAPDVPDGADTGPDVGPDVLPDGGAWRPFSDDSPWNTMIPADPELDPESAAMIADMETSSPWGEHLDVNIAGYSIPLYWAGADTPRVEVLCNIGGMGFTGDNGMNATAMVPMPAGAAPDPESDHHLLIVDLDDNLEWGMWNASNDGGTWTCGLGANIDLLGTGVRPPANDNPTWYTSHGARACGFPLVAGLIRTAEIEAGRIDHALVFAYPHIRSGWYTPPASTGQARVGDDAVSWRGVPCGGRIQLDPAIDLDSLGLSRSGRIIALALQEYGAYVGDYSGALSLYAENSPEAQAVWASGVLDTYELMDIIDMAWFRVIRPGTLYDNGNGD